MNLNKTLRLGTRTGVGSVYVEVKYKDGKLSITGVEGPTSNGDARGGCGQCHPVRVDVHAQIRTGLGHAQLNSSAAQDACIRRQSIG